MYEDKNLKEFNKILIMGLVFTIVMIISCIRVFILGSFKIDFIFTVLPILIMSLMLILNRECKKEFVEQLKEETEEFTFKF